MHVWWYRAPSGSVTWPQSSHPADPKARPANCPPIPRRNPEIIAPVCGNELRSYDGMTSCSHAADRVRLPPVAATGLLGLNGCLIGAECLGWPVVAGRGLVSGGGAWSR